MTGKIPLDQLVKEMNLDVEWKAFELRPEGKERPELTAEQLSQIKAGLEALGKKCGIYMTYNEKSKNSRFALEGSKFAEDRGLGNEYHDAVFAAQFQELKDINDVEVLSTIAGRVGLNSDEFRQAVLTGEYRQAVEKDLEEARRLGIHTIPCFIVNGRAVHGAQGYDTLEKFFKGITKGFPLPLPSDD